MLSLLFASVPSHTSCTLALVSMLVRMCRPVLHLATGKAEWIGPMEQQFMEVRVRFERTHTKVPLIPPWEDQCEWHRRARMTGPDCAVVCNLINIHTHTLTHKSRCFRNKYSI